MKTEEKMTTVGGPLRVAVMGSSDVGKSALTVRYLTKRFIGEYRSDTDMLYKCTRVLEDSQQQPVEIIDSAATSIDAINDEHVHWAEAFIIVYNVCDRDSFIWAHEALEILSQKRPSARILIIGNKIDMEHAREVDENEMRSLAFIHAARFRELSIIESAESVITTMDAYLRDVRSHRINNGKTGSISPKGRKLSVAKMLGNLIGRNSPPPAPITELIILDKAKNNSRQPIRQL